VPIPLLTGLGWIREYSCDFVVHQGVVRGGLPFSLSPSLPLCLFLLSCAQPTDSTDEGAVERERSEVSGSIVEDTV